MTQTARINADFLRVGKEINSDLSFDFALKGALCEGAGSAMFFAETEGELTLGSAAAFAADSVWRGNRAKQSNTPSVSPQKRRRSTFLREEGFKKKPLFISSPPEENRRL